MILGFLKAVLQPTINHANEYNSKKLIIRCYNCVYRINLYFFHNAPFEEGEIYFLNIVWNIYY